MRERLSAVLPPMGWLRDYHRTTLVQDLLAACIMTVLVIPQSLAYALLAGLPAQAGLYASLLPVIGYALFASSSALAVGPVALIALMSATTVGDIQAAGLADFATCSLVLALLCGVILFVMGVARLGFMANFISHPVISGFISGSALIIILSQVGTLLGIPTEGSTLPALLRSIGEHVGRFNDPTAILGIGSVLFLLLARRFSQRLFCAIGLPIGVASTLARLAPMLVVIATAAVTAWRHLDTSGVRVIGNLPSGLPGLSLPAINLPLVEALAVPAILISLVIFVESTSIAHRIAARRGERLDANQELMGLGAANLAAAVSGGLAVAGGFSRSVVNIEAGARTQLAGVFSAIGIALVTVFFTDLFHYLPKATLAAIIIVAVTTLVDFRAIADTWRYSRQDGLALLTTLLLTLLAGVIPGILAGVALSLMLYLYRTSRPHVAVVGRIPGTEHFRNQQRYAVETHPLIVILRVDETLYFANARYLDDCVSELVSQRPEATDFVLMCTGINTIDASALETLEAINTRLQSAGIQLHLSEVKGPVMDRLRRTRFLQNLSGEVFLSTFDAWRTLSDRHPLSTHAIDSSGEKANPSGAH
ncbi:sulfate permease [Marinobacter sp. R17]|uniref:SulP family inorganic anion transporter n=1 Tax=Marinobacter sp. R17 TaxID=2484250 RepID=UPI000F4CC989|nr:sulfate permease [Marinobacter sp. R17]ROT99704.1 sulfate permease [Marinobacter sp. R17]